jgi:predicted glycosyltransferase
MRDFGGIKRGKREGVVIWVTCSSFGFGWVCEMLTLLGLNHDVAIP